MGGSLVALSGVASAAATTVGSFKAANATTIPAGTTKNQTIGTLVLTITKTVGKNTFTAQVVTLTVSDTTTHAGSKTAFTVANSGTNFKPKVVGPGAAATCAFATATGTAAGDKVITCKLSKTAGVSTAQGKTAAAVFTWHTLRVNSKTGQGKVKVTAADTINATNKFSPTSTSPASYTPTTTLPTRVELINTATRPVPPIGEGTVGRTVGSWQVVLTSSTSTGTLAVNQGAAAGSSLKITLQPHTGTSTCPKTDAVAFDGVPKFTVTTLHSTHVSATPKLSGKLTGNNGCTGFFAPNVLTMMFTTAFKFTAKNGRLVINVTTVKYSVAPTTKVGTVTVSDSFHRSSSTKTGFLKTTGQTTTFTSTNAVVSWAYVTVKSPKVVAPRSVDAPIGTIDVVESVGGTVPTGYVCLSIRDSERATAPGWRNTTTYVTTFTRSKTPYYFNGASKPSVKVSGGNASASTAAFATTTTPRTPSIVRFKVGKGTTKSTFVVSGLAINAYTTTHPSALPPLVTAWYSTSGTCTGTAKTTVQGTPNVTKPTDNVAVAFVVGTPPATQIYGATSDATAVAELESVYGGPGFTGTCPTTLGGHHPVLLARDTFYSDALASQYLASYLNTGTLLTHPSSLPTVTKSALAFEGITTVYVIGGPLAITTAVVNAIKALPVYHCGGRKVTVTTGTGVPKLMKVIRVTGPTEYATAEAITGRVPLKTVGKVFAQNAYATGKNFNDTTGNESAKPSASGALSTAILATGKGFQDAMSASALSYATHLPIVLTTPNTLSKQASDALTSLNVSQVIVMGGPLAVANSVVTAVEAMKVTGGSRNISVLRIAGTTYTDTAVMLSKFELGTTNGGIDWDQASAGPCAAATTFGTAMRTLVARGTYFTDGLTGAVLEACGVTPFSHFFHSAKRMPLLLTMNPSTVGAPLTAYLKAAGLAPATGGTGVTSTGTEHLKYLTIIGGPFAVTPLTIAQMLTDLKS